MTPPSLPRPRRLSLPKKNDTTEAQTLSGGASLPETPPALLLPRPLPREGGGFRGSVDQGPNALASPSEKPVARRSSATRPALPPTRLAASDALNACNNNQPAMRRSRSRRRRGPRMKTTHQVSWDTRQRCRESGVPLRSPHTSQNLQNIPRARSVDKVARSTIPGAYREPTGSLPATKEGQTDKQADFEGKVFYIPLTPTATSHTRAIQSARLFL